MHKSARGRGRRTVLQLDDNRPQQNPGLGLVSYGGSDEEREEGEVEAEDRVATEEEVSTRFVSGETYDGVVTSAAPQTKSAGKDRALDMQIADFMKEIDAIPGPEPDDKPDSTQPEEAKESMDEDDDEDDILDEDEPTTDWKHCLDEGTQHYYYWNMETNEVQWQIPAAYSRFLLLKREYDERKLNNKSTSSSKPSKPSDDKLVEFGPKLPPQSPGAPAAPPPTKPDEASLEFIDKELDMALEHDAKTKETPRSFKRSADEFITFLKRKTKRDMSPEEESNKTLEKHAEMRRRLKADITDLSSLILSKMQFLEVGRRDLSKLQVLLIEIETRMTDWRAGGLDSAFLLRRLEDADDQLAAYEQTAAPPGWSCFWDRNYKRYYYSNDVTKTVSWEYPDEDDEVEPQNAPQKASSSHPSPGPQPPPPDQPPQPPPPEPTPTSSLASLVLLKQPPPPPPEPPEEEPEVEVPAPLPPPPESSEVEPVKKRKKKLVTSNFSHKKRNVSSLVEKWQQVQEEAEEGEL